MGYVKGYMVGVVIVFVLWTGYRFTKWIGLFDDVPSISIPVHVTQ